MKDVVIIGAGVVGGMVARELARYRLDVAIVEREGDVAMGATKANSAIVHAGFDAQSGTLKAKLNVRGSELMPAVTKALGVKYRRNGALVVGFSEEDKATLADLLARGQRNGVAGLELLDREQALALEPNLGDGVTCALHAPTGAIVCPYELCIAAIGNAMDNGAELLLDFDVTAITREGDGWRVRAADGRELTAKTIVNCAGVHSDDVAALAGDKSFTVSPRRGEYMLLDKECGTLVSHTVFRCPTKMGKGILVTPTVDGNLLLGPTAENIDDKEDLATTPAGFDRIRAQAGEQVKGVNFGKVITSFAGLRSVGSTGDFIIDTPAPGFVNAAGIESPGLSASPAIAEYIVEMLRDAGMELTEKENYLATRPAAHAFRDEMTVEEKNEVIRRDPRYAHIICRCETVSEGEIVAELERNPRPRDLDGIKRRTRAMMGRCQGGFCTPYLIELLAAELNIPYEGVTKFGGASTLNVGETKQ